MHIVLIAGSGSIMIISGVDRKKPSAEFASASCKIRGRIRRGAVADAKALFETFHGNVDRGPDHRGGSELRLGCDRPACHAAKCEVQEG